MVSTTAQRQSPEQSSDEWRLVAAARAGDVAARDRLLARYLDDVYAVALRLLGDRDLAQDAAQDALVSALNALGRFRGEASFRTWILRIALNSARSLLRRRLRRREVAITVVEDTAAEGEVPATGAALRTEAARVREAVQALPEKQRLSVSLRIEQGLSYAEIAQLIDSTEGAVRVNYHLGIKRLRGMLT